jgi:hypothetical protein
MSEVDVVNALRDALTPHADRLPSDQPGREQILAEHARAVTGGDAGYRDPATGLFVMTSVYLADRGRCCGNGCRHCPFC